MRSLRVRPWQLTPETSRMNPTHQSSSRETIAVKLRLALACLMQEVCHRQGRSSNGRRFLSASASPQSSLAFNALSSSRTSFSGALSKVPAANSPSFPLEAFLDPGLVLRYLRSQQIPAIQTTAKKATAQPTQQEHRRNSPLILRFPAAMFTAYDSAKGSFRRQGSGSRRTCEPASELCPGGARSTAKETNCAFCGREAVDGVG